MRTLKAIALAIAIVIAVIFMAGVSFAIDLFSRGISFAIGTFVFVVVALVIFRTFSKK